MLIRKICVTHNQTTCRDCLFFLCLSLASDVLAFDVGSFIDMPEGKFWQLELITQEHKRNIEVESGQENRALKEYLIYPLKNQIRVNIISLRTTGFYQKKFAFYFEYGLYNDLEITSRSPFFYGIGGFVVLEKLGGINIVPFAAFHRIQSYQYEIFATSEPYLYYAYIQSYLDNYLYGLQLVAKLPLSDNNVIFPYLGILQTGFTSQWLSSIKLETNEIRDSEFFIKDSFRVQSRKENRIVGGITLTRRNYSTVRFEVQHWKARNSISLNFGFMF